MLLDNIRLLLKLYYRPLAAMSGIIDEGKWFFGLAVAILVSMLFQFAVARDAYREYEAARVEAPSAEYDRAGEYGEGEDPAFEGEPAGRAARWSRSFSPLSGLTTLLALALFYVPGTILAAVLFERLGSFGVALQRDYVPLVTCTLMSWTAAYLPIALAGLALAPWGLGPVGVLLLWLIGTAYFAGLMVCAVRTVFGISFGKAVATISVSWVSLFLSAFLFVLASPFFLILLYFLFRGQFGDIGSSFRQRQGFRRSLEAATVNPRDAEAHYQLGLIYQQRRQYGEAIARFNRAIEIDAREVDAHFQLGRIARDQGRLQEAINHFNAVVVEDDKHSQHEIWREIGATYADASMYEDARTALEKYIERRPYDPEGLYYLGETYTKLGNGPAREMFERCIEAARTTPYYRQGQAGKWRRLAEERLKEG
jgi:tetratricopeptide (TPR) repeat protein